MILVSIAAAAALLAGGAHAHTRIFSAWVNGQDQGDGRSTYVRSPPTNNPVKNLTLPDLACNTAGGAPMPSFVSAAAGNTISFEWYHNTRNDDIIDASHKGPIQVYIAPYMESNGASPIWTKIASHSYDSSTQKWAVDDLIANGGKHDFTIPSSVAPGKYLIRGEIIALHEADANYEVNPVRGAQFYPDCVQFDITGSGSDSPPNNFNFNTGYTEADPGIVFDLYSKDPASYQAPGPDVWSGGSSGSSPASSSASPSAPASSGVFASTSGADAPTSAPASMSVPTTLVTAVASPSSPSTPLATGEPGESEGDGDDTCDA